MIGFMCLFQEASQASNYFFAEMGECKTAGLCSWKQDQVKNELDAWENELYFERMVPVLSWKSSVLGLFQDTLRTSISVHYLPRQKKLSGYKTIQHH
jgi:hypothetical protein